MKIFFIIGTGRCGTQMLRNIMEQWNNVKILPETHFITTLYNKYKLNNIDVREFLEVIDNTYSSNGEKWMKIILNSSKKTYYSYKRDYIEYCISNNIYGNIKDYLEALFIYLYGSNDWYGDKTPHYGANLEIIKQIWPEAKLIYLKRDGINTAVSMIQHPGFVKLINGNVKFRDIGNKKYNDHQISYSKTIPSIESSIIYWKHAVNQIDNSIKKSNTKDILEIKYEDLIYNTKNTLLELVDYLQLDSNVLSILNGTSIIRPFSCRKKPIRIPQEKYNKLYEIVSDEMQYHDYPYLVNKQYNIFTETLRTAYYYLHKTISYIYKIYNHMISIIHRLK